MHSSANTSFLLQVKCMVEVLYFLSVARLTMDSAGYRIYRRDVLYIGGPLYAYICWCLFHS